MLIRAQSLALASLMFMTVAFTVQAHGQNDKDIVARVGDETISREQFDQALTRAQHMANLVGDSMQEGIDASGQMRLLDWMIRVKVVEQLAKQAKVKVTDKDVEEFIEERTKQFVSKDSMDNYLENAGLTLDELKTSVEQQLLSDKFLKEATKDVSVSEAELREEYDKMVENGRFQMADMAHILIRLEGDDDAAVEAAKTRADAARQRVINGEKFTDVARAVSDDTASAGRGGIFLRLSPGQGWARDQQFAQRIFTQPVGEVSEPFRSPLGWHILLVFGRGAADFELVKEPLEEEIVNARRRQEISRIVTEAKENLDIEIFLSTEGEGVDPDAAPALLDQST